MDLFTNGKRSLQTQLPQPFWASPQKKKKRPGDQESELHCSRVRTSKNWTWKWGWTIWKHRAKFRAAESWSRWAGELAWALSYDYRRSNKVRKWHETSPLSQNSAEVAVTQGWPLSELEKNCIWRKVSPRYSRIKITDRDYQTH